MASNNWPTNQQGPNQQPPPQQRSASQQLTITQERRARRFQKTSIVQETNERQQREIDQLQKDKDKAFRGLDRHEARLNDIEARMTEQRKTLEQLTKENKELEEENQRFIKELEIAKINSLQGLPPQHQLEQENEPPSTASGSNNPPPPRNTATSTVDQEIPPPINAYNEQLIGGQGPTEIRENVELKAPERSDQAPVEEELIVRSSVVQPQQPHPLSRCLPPPIVIEPTIRNDRPLPPPRPPRRGERRPPPVARNLWRDKYYKTWGADAHQVDLSETSSGESLEEPDPNDPYGDKTIKVRLDDNVDPDPNWEPKLTPDQEQEEEFYSLGLNYKLKQTVQTDVQFSPFRHKTKPRLGSHNYYHPDTILPNCNMNQACDHKCPGYPIEDVVPTTLVETIKDGADDLRDMARTLVKLFWSQNDHRLESNRSEERVLKRVDDKAADTTRKLTALSKEVEELKAQVVKLKKLAETTSKESNCQTETTLKIKQEMKDLTMKVTECKEEV